MRFNRDGSRLALAIGTTTTPPEIHVIDIAAASITRWTRSDRNPAAAGSFTPARRIHFRTWDRSDGVPRVLDGFLYLPTRAGPHPVLIQLHDGPGGESRPGFDAWVQFLVNELGIAVIEPNLRGSGGAGVAFAALDEGPLRGDAIRDLGSLIVWIGAQRNLDPGRVAVAGRGYGGYQAIAALAKYGDRLRGAVAIDPLPDLVAATDAAAIACPVLLVRLTRPVAGRQSGAEQILWRMRGTRRDARYLALDTARCATDCRDERAAAWAAIGGYLDQLLGAKTPDPSPER
jgi:dipeptidyl aminopeptidase/acylaminoacyl peptidase